VLEGGRGYNDINVLLRKKYSLLTYMNNTMHGSLLVCRDAHFRFHLKHTINRKSLVTASISVSPEVSSHILCLDYKQRKLQANGRKSEKSKKDESSGATKTHPRL
jgi:hypothetical protein